MATTTGDIKTQKNTSAIGFDRGWVFCFSVLPKNADQAESLLKKIYQGAHIVLQRMPAGDVNGTFRPESTRGDVFFVRQTPETDADIGLLAGEVEDAFRDAGIHPGPRLQNMATIDGVSYTSYRNETDPEGNLILAGDWAELEKARPAHRLYNPFVKPDPWADLAYEYAPAAAQLEAPAQKLSAMDIVEDFDTDLGTLLSQVFSGVDSIYLTQPESTKGWIFDQSYGHEPFYAFYACPVTIKPVRQTLRKAGIPFHHTEHSDWHGVIISKAHFDTAQNILQEPSAVQDLRAYYLQAAQAAATNGSAPSESPEPSFVSDI